MKIYLIRTVADKHIQAAFVIEQAAIDYGRSWINHRADRAEWRFDPLTDEWVHKRGDKRLPAVLELFRLNVNE